MPIPEQGTAKSAGSWQLTLSHSSIAATDCLLARGHGYRINEMQKRECLSTVSWR